MLKVLLSEFVIEIGMNDKLYASIAIPVWTNILGMALGVVAHFIWR